MRNYGSRDPFRKTPKEELRTEQNRRFWLYYASPEGNPYKSEGGNPALADFKGLPEYVSGMFNYVPFIVDVDLYMLVGTFDLDAISNELGESEVQISRALADELNFKDRISKAVLSALVTGDGYIKVVPDYDESPGVRLVVLDSAAVHPRLDPHDHNVVKEVLIDYRYRDEADNLHRYKELWTNERVEVRIDDEVVPEMTGENPFGFIPVTHFSCRTLSGSYFGRPVFSDIISDIDKLNSAVGALFEVYKYYGSPKLVLKGIMAPDFELDPDIRQFWQIPSGDSDLSFLEWRNATGLVDEVLKLDYIVRRKLPEFILANVNDTSFPASGYSVSLQLSILDSRLKSMADSFSRSAEEVLARATFIAGLGKGCSRVTLGKSANDEWSKNLESVGRLMGSGVLSREEARAALGIEEKA